MNYKQPIKYCLQCQENLCDKCGNDHNRLYLNHKLSFIKYILPKSFNYESICNECGKELENLDNYCDKCKIPLCNECGENHSKNNPNHNLKIKRKIVKNKNIDNENQLLDLNINNEEKNYNKNIPDKNDNNINLNENINYNKGENINYNIIIPNNKCISC